MHKGKCVVCLKARASCNQLQNNRINYQFNQDLHNLSLKHGTRRLRIKNNSIEENEETVDRKDIEELETQISIECIKGYNYFSEIEKFEADCTVKEVKKWVKSLEQRLYRHPKIAKKEEKTAAKQSSTITINKFTVEQDTKVIKEKFHLLYKLIGLLVID